jgi:PhnB protein
MKKHAYIPEGYNAVIPALAVKDAVSAIRWYQKVFDAAEKMLLKNPDNTIAHGEITIGDTVVMVSEENPKYNKSPKTLNGNSVNLCIYVEDVDAVVQKAIDNGAKVLIPVNDQFYGDRSGRIEDPFGYIWIISTHIKDVSEEEMKKMMDEMMQQ